MPTCPGCGLTFRERPAVLVEPVHFSGYRGNLRAYQHNALNIAEYYSGERSFDFYRLPYSEFRKIVDCKFNSMYPRPAAKHEADLKRWQSKRASYFKFPEHKIALGMNFFTRKDSAAGMLIERLMLRISTGGFDINGEFEPFSLEKERGRLEDELQNNGVLKGDRNGLFVGLKDGAPTVSRLLIMNVPGADKYVRISNCFCSDYFPETNRYETAEKRKDHE